MFETVGEIRGYVEAELNRVVGSESYWCAQARPLTEARSGDRVPCGADSMLWDIRPRDPGYQGWFTLEVSPEAREFLLWYGSTHAGDAGADWIMRPAVHVAFDDVRIDICHSAPDFSLGGVLLSVLQHSERYPVNDFSFA